MTTTTIFFAEMDPLNRLLQDTCTGDVVLFSDKYWITSYITRTVTHSPWTHMALIVKFPRSSEIYLWELANSIFPIISLLDDYPKIKPSGVRLVRLRDKLKFFPSKGNRVTILRLQHEHWRSRIDFNDPCPLCCACRSPWDRLFLHDILFECMRALEPVPFRHNSLVFVKAAWKTHRRLIIRDDDDDDNQAQIPATTQPIPWSFNALQARNEIEMYLSQHGQRLFCSEAVVLLFKVCGIVMRHPDVHPKDFVPRDFGPRFIHARRLYEYLGNNQQLVLEQKVPLTSHWQLIPWLSLNLPAL